MCTSDKSGGKAEYHIVNILIEVCGGGISVTLLSKRSDDNGPYKIKNSK